MNWGYRIAIFYIGFVAIIITLVVLSSRQVFYLEDDDYYHQELQYQTRIDAVNRSKALPEGVSFEVVRSVEAGDNLVVRFPEMPASIQGNLQLYRPSSAAWDQHHQFSLESADSIVWPMAELEVGFWRARLDWESDGIAYYDEFDFVAQHPLASR